MKFLPVLLFIYINAIAGAPSLECGQAKGTRIRMNLFGLSDSVLYCGANSYSIDLFLSDSTKQRETGFFGSSNDGDLKPCASNGGQLKACLDSNRIVCLLGRKHLTRNYSPITKKWARAVVRLNLWEVNSRDSLHLTCTVENYPNKRRKSP
jgi:hypothetical protein